VDNYTPSETQDILNLIAETPESFILLVRAMHSKGQITVSEHDVKRSMRAWDMPFDENKLRNTVNRSTRRR
jgi:hypothetical protein